MTRRLPLAAATHRRLQEPTPDVPRSSDAPLVGTWWEHAEILLVADREPGSTHKFFHAWRVEVVAGAEQASPGRVLLTIPIGRHALVDSGWQYRLQRQAPRPGFEALDTATFLWVAQTQAPTPDPIAAASAQAQAWLATTGTPMTGASGAGAAD